MDNANKAHVLKPLVTNSFPVVVIIWLIFTIPLCSWGATKNLRDIISTAGASPKTVLVSSGTWDVTDDLKIPENIKLKLDYGAKISVVSGKTLTIHGLLSAPVEGIFIGTGNVVFDSNSLQCVFPQWWGAKGDGVNDDTASLQAAVNSFSNKGGEIIILEGVYAISTVGVKSNIKMSGDGNNAILKQITGSNYCITTNPNKGNTKPKDLNPNNIHFNNITFRGTVELDGFSEHVRLLDIGGASKITVNNCKFIGFRGDGIYVDLISISGQKLHNSNIVITNSTFDGLNKNNRNGISVIDCDGIIIEKCKFRNTTRPDMPGAIDFEPDYNYDIIRNVLLSQNTFENIGGSNIIQIVLTTKLKRLDSAIANIEITKNVINGDEKSNGIYVGQPQFADHETPTNNILISNNIVRNTKRSFMIFGVKGVKIINNTFDECTLDPYISYSEKNINVRDVTITGNTFKNLAKENGNGISIFGVNNLELMDNTFDNIGKADGTYGNALFFRKHGGPADHVTIINNIFKGRNTKIPIHRDRDNVTFPEHNKVNGNTFQDNEKAIFPAN